MNKRTRILIIPILILFGFCLAYLAVTTAQANHTETAETLVQQEQSGLQNISGFLLSKTKKTPGIQLIESDDYGLILELNTPEFQVVELQSETETCQALRIAGFGEAELPGSPNLPVIGTMIGIPVQSSPKLTILDSDLIQLPDKYNLCPVESPVFNINLAGEILSEGYKLERDLHAYSNDRFSPDVQVAIESTGFIRSQRVVQLRFQPFQYNPVTGELRYYKQIRVRLDYSHEQMPSKSSDFPLVEGAFESLFQNILINYDQAKTWRLPVQARTTLQAAVFDPPEPAYKLLIEQDGLYQVSYSDLQTAGIPVDSLDPQTFQMFNQGIETAIFVSGEGDASFDHQDYLVFYGQKVNTKYTDQNVYWLTWGNAAGLRMSIKDGTPSGFAIIPDYYLRSDHLEQDHFYRSSMPSGINNDHWYWDYVYASGSPSFKTFTTSLNHTATTPISATIRGLLKSYAAIPQHHTLVYLNGHLIDDATWASGGEHSFEVDIPQDYLINGTNEITVECPLDGGISYDVPFINWFEIDYQRLHTAENDLLAFNEDDPGTWEYQITAFSNDTLELYDVTNPDAPIRILNPSITPEGDTYTLAFEDTLVGESDYLALSTAQRLSPISITPDNPSDLQDANNGADYIIITHADFSSAVQPLAAHRAAQGMRTQIVDVQDIYDEFNNGIFDPNAIRDFLTYAYENWQSPAPAYVLLVGDGHYDFKDNFGYEDPYYIPPFLADVDPWLGEVPADNRYGCVSGEDSFPDMHLGRLTVRTASEANDVVAKIIDYELNPSPGNWNQEVTFVADNADDAGNFAAISDGIADFYLPDPYNAQKIYFGVTHSTILDTKNAIIDAINQGRLIVNYIGHAQLQYWATEKLLHRDDIPKLNNAGHLPFFVPMTCNEGAFHYPTPPGSDPSSFAESMVRVADNGAISSFSPTGFGVATGHDYLNKGLYEAIFNDDVYQVGPATTQAKLYLYANTGAYQDLLDTYLLFGDPATNLNVLPAETSISISVAPEEPVFSGDILTYTINYTNSGPATAHNVVISDELPSMLLNPSVSSSGSGITLQPGTNLIWNVEDLEPGMGGTITITAQIDSTFIGTIENQASIATSARETETSDNLTDPVTSQVEIPTGVLLHSFDASPWTAGSILVAWETITDVVGLQGFNIYRAESFSGERTRLNQDLINPKPAGTDSFVFYQLHDQQVTAGQTYYYWIEIVMNAETNTYGPSIARAAYPVFLPNVYR